MRDREDEAGGPLWTHGDMTFRIRGTARESDRIVEIRRPFALLGQTPDVDITIGDHAVTARHVYIHLDPRGVYAVDLATRGGTRLNGTDRPAGWLRPGDWLEVRGRRVELLGSRIGGIPHDPPSCDTDLLAETSRTTLVGVSLEPRRPAGRPWVLGSELVFLGRSAARGIQVKDRAVARTHCALLRTETAAYIVDLCGRHTWIDDRPLRRSSVIHDGQVLTIGSAPFVIRVEPAATTGPVAAAGPVPAIRDAFIARIGEAEVANGSDLPPRSRRSPPSRSRPSSPG